MRFHCKVSGVSQSFSFILPASSIAIMLMAYRNSDVIVERNVWDFKTGCPILKQAGQFQNRRGQIKNLFINWAGWF